MVDFEVVVKWKGGRRRLNGAYATSRWFPVVESYSYFHVSRSFS